MCRGIGKRIDDFQLLDNGARPSVVDDQRQCILVLRAHVDEMNVQPIDPGDELRQSIEPRLDLAPVVLCRPIVCELLNSRELHALGLIFDGLLFRPLSRSDASAEIDELCFRNVDAEGTDSVGFGRSHLQISMLRLLAWTCLARCGQMYGKEASGAGCGCKKSAPGR